MDRSSSSRERNEYRRFTSEDDDYSRGWFGDSEGNAEAARRGWRSR